MFFPKQSRLLRPYEFRRIGKLGKELEGRYMRIKILEGQYSRKLGLTVSKKFGKAVQRNRFKRITREAFRTLQKELPLDIHIAIVPRLSAQTASMQEIKEELAYLVRAPV